MSSKRIAETSHVPTDKSERSYTNEVSSSILYSPVIVIGSPDVLFVSVNTTFPVTLEVKAAVIVATSPKVILSALTVIPGVEEPPVTVSVTILLSTESL